MLRFVLRSKALLNKLKEITVQLITNHPTIKVITANIQSVHQAILEGDEEIILTKEDSITHLFADYTLYQGPRSFFQTNNAMALRLYKQFQYELSVCSVESFLDLYCGVGAFAFFAGKYCAKVLGIEISDAAIYYANKAREVNHSVGIDFIASDVEAYLAKQSKPYFDAIMVNPPRRGLNHSINHHLMHLEPAYLFYSSCNAETLKRDLLILQMQYEIQSLQLFDMFPFTSHFETLAVLKAR